MRSWLLDRWLHLRASYWFIPLIMVFGAVIAAFAMVALDRRLGPDWVAQQSWLYVNQPEGARALLSTVAGSMITVAGVTFSMTLLAVSHASSQIGPRLMTRFMRDRGNQFTLGTYIATFLYCLVVLRTVQSGTEGENAIAVFVPQLAILVGLAFAIASVLVLIYFIHHVPQSISVARTIARVGDELVGAICNLFPENIGEGGHPELQHVLPDNFEQESKRLAHRGRAGYMRVLGGESLLRLAAEHDLVIELAQRPGDFAIEGQPVMRVWPADRVTEELESDLLGVCSWGTERTKEQDVLFPVEQLIEILGKAMSPGVNGQYTALLCINQIERALAIVLAREVPERGRYDEQGRLRVVAQPITQAHLLASIFRPLRQFTRGDWLVTDAVLRMISRLQGMPSLARAVDALAAEAALVRDDVRFASMPDSEKQLLLGTSG